LRVSIAISGSSNLCSLGRLLQSIGYASVAANYVIATSDVHLQSCRGSRVARHCRRCTCRSRPDACSRRPCEGSQRRAGTSAI